MFTLQSLLIMTLLPAGVAVALMLAARAIAPRQAALLDGAAIGAAFVVAFLARHGRPAMSSLQALEAWHCLLPLAGIAALLSLVGGLLRARLDRRGTPDAANSSARSTAAAVIEWLLRTVLIAAALGVMLQVYVRETWTRGESATWLASLGVGALVCWAAADLLERRAADSVAGPLSAAVVGMSTALCLLLTGSQKVGELGIMLGSACCAAALMAMWRRRPVVPTAAARPAGSSGLAVAVPLLAALWLNGRFYAETPGWMTLVLAAALPAGLGVAVLMGRAGWKRWLAVGSATLIVAAGAIVPAILAFKPDTAEY